MHDKSTSAAKSPSSNWQRWVIPLGIAVLTIVTYSPVFHAGFIWDDDSMLTGNRLMTSPNGLFSFWCTTAPSDYFPLTYSSLWLEWQLWGLNPLGYHVVNVLLHAASSVLLWRVFELLRLPAAWIGAALFAVHPVNVESVAWIAERKNALAMFFFMLSVWGFLKFQEKDKRRFYVLSLVTFVLSLLAKTSAVAWPVMMIIFIWWKRESFRRALCTIPFFAVSLTFGLITIWFQNHRAIAGDVIHNHDIATRVSIAGSAVWFYLCKAIVPFNLSFVYPEWAVDTRNISAYLPAVALALLAAVAWTFRNSWGRIILVAILWFILLLFPVLGFFDIYFQRYSFVADHWQYFALPAIVALSVVGLARLKLQWVIGPALILLFAGLSFARANIYHDGKSLWTDTLQKNPKCFLAHNNLGLILDKMGLIDEAIEHYKLALGCEPNLVEVHNNWGAALFDAGRVDEAAEHFRAANIINSNSPLTHYNVGNVYDRWGRTNEAIAEFREAIRLKNDYPQALNNLACILVAQGKMDEALDCLQRAVSSDPTYGDALSNLRNVLNAKKQARQGQNVTY